MTYGFGSQTASSLEEPDASSPFSPTFSAALDTLRNENASLRQQLANAMVGDVSIGDAVGGGEASGSRIDVGADGGNSGANDIGASLSGDAASGNVNGEVMREGNVECSNAKAEQEMARMARELEGARAAVEESEKQSSLLIGRLEESEKKKALLETTLAELNDTTTK